MTIRADGRVGAAQPAALAHFVLESCEAAFREKEELDEAKILFHAAEKITRKPSNPYAGPKPRASRRRRRRRRRRPSRRRHRRPPGRTGRRRGRREGAAEARQGFEDVWQGRQWCRYARRAASSRLGEGSRAPPRQATTDSESGCAVALPAEYEYVVCARAVVELVGGALSLSLLWQPAAAVRRSEERRGTFFDGADGRNTIVCERVAGSRRVCAADDSSRCVRSLVRAHRASESGPTRRWRLGLTQARLRRGGKSRPLRDIV